MIRQLVEMSYELQDTIKEVVDHIVDIRRRTEVIDTELAIREYLKDNNKQLTDDQIDTVIREVNAQLINNRLRLAQAVQK